MSCIVTETSIHFDNRGFVYCPLDNIGNTSLLDPNPPYSHIRRTYVVSNWIAGTIRAWHFHRYGWTGLHVIEGAATLVGLPHEDYFMYFPENRGDVVAPTKLVSHAKKPQVLWIPPGFYNGSMSLVDNTKILVYSTLTFNDVKSDDGRRAPTPKEIKEFFEVPIK